MKQSLIKNIKNIIHKKIRTHPPARPLRTRPARPLKPRLALAITLLALALSSCADAGSPGASVLWYQNGVTKAEMTLSAGKGEYALALTRTDAETRLELLSPENIKGVKITRASGAYYISSGETKIPLSADVFSGVAPILDALSLPEEEIRDVSLAENGESIFTVESERGVYTVSVGKDGMPRKITYEGERTFELSNITLET